MKIEFDCCFCGDSEEVEVASRFTTKHSEGEILEHCFCPRHYEVALFLRDQCAGCVAGWPECGLAESFMWMGTSRDNPLTEDEKVKLVSGMCPRRVNGSFGFSRDTGFESMDISDKSTHGTATLSAIGEFRRVAESKEVVDGQLDI